jgi:hypothetical protein
VAIFYPPPEPRQAYPKVLPVTQGAQPRPTGPLGGAAAVLAAIGVWAAVAATPMPAQKPLNVAPLTLAYRQQPPLTGPLTATELNVAIRSWDAAFQSSPLLEDTAGWNVPAAAASQVPFARVVITWPLPDPATQKSPQTAPLALVYGQMPPAIGPAAQIAILVRAWDASFQYLQESEFIAGWNVPPTLVAQVPFRADTIIVRQAWEPGFQYPQESEYLAGWIPAAAQQPFVPFARLQSHILAAAIWWNAQSEGDNAPWNIPAVVSPTIPNARLQSHILASWLTDARAQRDRSFVTASGVLSAQIVAFSGDLSIAARFSGKTETSPRFSGETRTLAQFHGTISISPRFSGALIVTPLFDGELETDPG